MEDQFKQIAGLIGEPVRATILWTLMDGKALTATELALAASTTPQNISMHLTKLVQADLLSVERQGRHRYYRFSRKDVAYAIEAMANLVPPPSPKAKAMGEQQSAIRHCRTCYDHLAGKIAVAITDSFLQKRFIEEHKKTFTITTKGEIFFSGLGIDIAEIQQLRRIFLRPCLDWSERRYHMAGALAAALLEYMLVEDWIRRQRDSRAITITSKGESELYKHFKLNVR